MPATTDELGHTHDLLVREGYKLVEDSWQKFGRRTYLHDDSADRSFIMSLASALRSAGWQTCGSRLRSFRHCGAQQEIDLEPGGTEATGHFLHHMNAMPEG